jgi:hypothetical protein
MLEVFEPKYSTKQFLIAKYKVTNYINAFGVLDFEVLKGTYAGTWKCNSQVALQSSIINNGKIDCYAINIKDCELIKPKIKQRRTVITQKELLTVRPYLYNSVANIEPKEWTRIVQNIFNTINADSIKQKIEDRNRKEIETLI